MLGHRDRRWTNIEPTFGQRICLSCHTAISLYAITQGLCPVSQWHKRSHRILYRFCIYQVWTQQGWLFEPMSFNHSKPDFIIFIFIHYKSRIVVATCSGWRWLKVDGNWKKYYVIISSSMKMFVIYPLGTGNLIIIQRCEIICFGASWGFK